MPSVIEIMNSMKPLINEARDTAVEKFEGEELNEFLRLLDAVLTSVNEAASYLETKHTDEQDIKDWSKELNQQMFNSMLYKDIIPEQRALIIQSILENKSEGLLDEKALRELITADLRNMPPDQLTTTAYSKADITRMGKKLVEDINVGEGVYYSRGLEALMAEVDTPDGIDNAVALGLANIMMNDKKRNAYILNYHGVK